MSTPSGTFANLADLGAASTPEQATLAPDTSHGFIPGTLGPLVTFNEQKISPPSTLYISRDDRLRIIMVSQVGAGLINAGARLLKADGTIQIFQFPIGGLPPSGSIVTTTFEFDLAEGFLLDIAVFPVGPVRRGDVFCIIGLIRSTGAQAIWVQTLVQDYLVGQQAVGWPGFRSPSSLENNTFVREFTAPAPAAGVSAITLTLPTGLVWRPLLAQVFLTTNATVINRQVSATMKATSATAFGMNFSAVQPASTTFRYMLGPGFPFTSDGLGNFMMPMPGEYKMTDSSNAFVQFQVANMQATDQLSAAVMIAEQWLQP